MKKIITIVLVLAMALGLCACGGSGEGSKGADGLQIGYARENITPNFLVGITGYSDSETRKNTDGFLDYIYITCIAAKEGEETVLFYTMDSSAMKDSRADGFREYISEAVGIPGDRMFFGATHSHSAPDYTSTQYAEFIKDKMIKVTQDAIADLSAAKIYATSTQAEKMTFVRHYKMEDGTYSGSNFGNWSIDIEDHAGPADEEMQVVKFDRVDESKKDVVLVNFQAHNDHAKELGYNSLSAGYVAGLRDELEAQSGCDVAFFMGASGNLNPTSRITSENHNLQCKDYGKKLGQIAYEAMSNLEEVGGSGIAVTNYTMDAEIDHSWDHMLAEAQEVYNMWKNVGKSAGDALGKTYGFSSSYQARDIITRYNKPATEPIKQGAFRIHDLGFITGPYEMFCGNGMAVKDASPFKYTFIIMGNSGYIPDKAAFEYRSYESDCGMYAKGVAENLQNKYIEMLKSIQ